MFFWRVTKYDPKNRDMSGVYLVKDEWTSYSDIGTNIYGKQLTYDEYIEIEDAYVTAIKLFMKCNKIDSLMVASLEKNHELNNDDKYISNDMKNSFQQVKTGINLRIDEVELLARLILREKLWCKLESKDMFVHFGYDYYMYIGRFC
jgi:hypothetical protein